METPAKTGQKVGRAGDGKRNISCSNAFLVSSFSNTYKRSTGKKSGLPVLFHRRDTHTYLIKLVIQSFSAMKEMENNNSFRKGTETSLRLIHPC